MKITRIEAIPVGIAFAKEYVIATAKLSVAHHIMVRMHTDAGIVGLGEAATAAAKKGEANPIDGHDISQEGGLAALETLAAAVVGEDPLNIVRLHAKMNAALDGNPFAKAAIDIAAWDVAGKARGVPVCALLGGAQRDRIEVGQTIRIADLQTMAEEAKECLARGFKSIKVKVGLDPDGDVDRVRVVREAAGPGFPIRVDANQGYSYDDAVRALSGMERYDLLYVEQPVSRHDLQGMAKLAEHFQLRIVADECVLSPSDAIEVVRHRAGDIINIKIMKAGGLWPALQIAFIAQAAGWPVCIGSMIEFGVGTAAGAHFAAALPSLPFPSDVKGPTMFVDDVLATPLHIADGITTVPAGPGLGVALDDAKLAQHRTPGR